MCFGTYNYTFENTQRMLALKLLETLKEEIKTANLINTFHKTRYSVSSEKKSTFFVG